MPRPGCGFVMRLAAGKPSRSSSLPMTLSPVPCTTAICSAPGGCHCLIRCPSTDVSPHGNSNFGLPIRDDAPAARIMTPQAIIEVTSFRGAGDKTCGHNLARVKTNENNEPQSTDNRQPATSHEQLCHFLFQLRALSFQQP